MKRNIFMRILKQSLLLVLMIFISNLAFSQDESTKTATELTAKFSNINGVKSLKAKITYDKDGDQAPLVGVKVAFYSENKDEKLIGEVVSNSEGLAEFKLDNNLDAFKNDTGLMVLKASYLGSEQYDAAMVDFNGMEVVFNLDFSIVTNEDSTKTKMIECKANAIGKGGVEIPLNGFDVSFFTPSLFGQLPIGTGYLEEGACTLKFPKKLPGDSTGKLMVYAKIIDNEIYGDVSFSKDCSFAKKHVKFIKPIGKLWSTDPPIWMVITLFILIFGVWSHYFYIFIKMRRIYKLGKQ